jgi:hypothetical protein
MRDVIALAAAFSACLGTLPARADDGSRTPPAAGSRAGTKGAAVRFDKLAQGDSPAETYDLNALGLVHMKSGWSLFSPSEWWRPVRGKYRDAMTYVDFFEAVGRPDLASAQASHNTVSDVLFYGGLLVLAGGIVVAVHGGTSQSTAETYAGLGTAGGGLVCSIVGGAISGPIVNEDEAARMADGYNLELGAHLRVDGKSGRSSSSAGPWQLTLRATF